MTQRNVIINKNKKTQEGDENKIVKRVQTEAVNLHLTDLSIIMSLRQSHRHDRHGCQLN